jgi:hypothetical protein
MKALRITDGILDKLWENEQFEHRQPLKQGSASAGFD